MNAEEVFLLVAAIGLVVLLYDHALTFKDEVRLVWNAKASIAKYALLLNRYLVAFAQIGVAICGFHVVSSQSTFVQIDFPPSHQSL